VLLLSLSGSGLSGEQKVINIMSNRVNNIPSAGDKKRKEVISVSANNESGPPKKRVRKRCSVDSCTNIVVKGGLCLRHGAQVNRCSVDECTNKRVKGGVCIKHGAKTKLCSVSNCTNNALKGGVCWRHGAKVEVKLCSFVDCTKYAQKGGVCMKHGAKVKRKRCSVGNCPNQRQRRGVCKRHGAYSNNAPPLGNFLCGEVQGGGNQNYASTVVEISDSEGEGGKNQSPIAGRKRKAGVSKQQSKTAASNDAGGDRPGEFVQEIPEKKGAVVDGKNAESDKFSSGVANLKDDSEQDSSDMRPQKRARGEGNLKDDREQDASDVAPTKGGSEEGTCDAMEDGDSWGGDGQNEYDCGGGDDGDVNSEEGKQSHVVPDEIVTTMGANDVEKDSEIQRLATELEDANNTVDTLNDRLKEMSNEFEAAQSRSKSEHEQQQSELKDLRNQLDILSSQSVKKTEDAARLETSLRSKELEMQSAVLASAAQLKEANDKVDELSAKLEEADKDGTEKIQRQINKFHSMQQEIRSLQSKNLRLEQQLRSSKSEQDNLNSALAKAASKNQTHITRCTSITSSRKRISKKNRLLGVDSLSTLTQRDEEGSR